MGSNTGIIIETPAGNAPAQQDRSQNEPSSLSGLTVEEQKIADHWSGGPHDPTLARDELLHELFEQTADLHPTAPACCGPGNCWALSYGELEARANRLAAVLRANGAKRGEYVGMLLPRGADVYVTLLAIMKSGAAYVPLDPDYPADRIAYILADCRVKAIVTSSVLVRRLPALDCQVLRLDQLDAEMARQGGTRLEPGDAGARPDDTAYVIYTSGSTGRPKGVPITHHAVCNLARAEGRIFGVQPEDRVYQGFSIAFDASVEEVWLAFHAGATLVVGTTEMVRAGPALAGMLREAGVTVLSCVPTLLAMFQEDVPAVRLLILGGEVCPPDLVRRWSRPCRRVVNTYGPTEATVIATYGECLPERPVTIGRPAPNYRVYILDEELKAVSAGTPGELCISGPGLSPGYLNRPELTYDKFRANPFCADQFYERIYRTGDLARHTETGEIEFLGRIDSQVKLRGFRIELAEIEAVVRESSRETGGPMRAAAVTLREDLPGLQELIAYIVVKPGETFDVKTLREALRRRLPAYMMPAWFETVPDLPTLSSGKIDRKSLPAPRRERIPDAAATTDPPRTPVEKKIASAWKHFAGMEDISRSADFFQELGAHSLLVARLVSDLRRDAEFPDLSVLDMYNHPTLEKLAAVLESRRNQRMLDSRTVEPTPSRLVPGNGGSTPSHGPAAHAAYKKKYWPFSIAQFLCLYFVVGFYSLQWLTPYITYVWMIEHDATRIVAIGWALGILLGVYPLMLLATIAAKWILVGRLKAGHYPLWSFFHLRWWLLQRILDAVAVEYLEGTPLMNVFYRMMGAKIGARVHLGSYSIGAFDLVTVGDDSSLDDATSLLGYTIEEGMLELGTLRIGKRCYVGASSVLRLNTVMEDDSRLLHMSVLSEGKIGRGETWFGSPARPLQNPGASRGPERPDRPTPWRRFWVSGLHAVGVFLLPMVYLAALFPGLVLLNDMAVEYGELWSLLAAPAVAVAFVLLLCLEIVIVKWVLLGRVKPGDYPICGWFYVRKWFVDQLMGLSLDVMGQLYATLYLNPWYRALGAKMGKRAEISTACAASPDLLDIGSESFIADAVLLGVPRVEGGILSLRTTRIGKRAFVGNSALLPAGTVVGDKTLIGVLSTPPLTTPGAAAADTTWLGSPAIFLPQRQASSAFPEAATFKPTRKLVALRLMIEFVRISLPITMFVVFTSLLITTVVELRPYLLPFAQLMIFPVLYFLAGVGAALFVLAAKWALMGRYKDSEKPLWSTFVWRSELLNALHEKLAGAYLLDMLMGTPLLCWFYRLMGMKIGKRVYLDSAEFTEFDLVSIGDDAMLNIESTIQTHLFEDRVMKMSTVEIGKGCSIGACSVVLYGSRLGDRAVLEELSLVMKGESLPDDTRWQGTPARRAADLKMSAIVDAGLVRQPKGGASSDRTPSDSSVMGGVL